MYFHYFVIIFRFIWTNLNPHHPMMLCAKYGWYGSVVLEKMEMLKVNYNDNDDDNDDNRQQFDQKNSLEPSTQVN